MVLPANTFLEPGVPVHLVAVARNAAGDSIAADLRWRTPDSTVQLDSTRGIVTAKATSGTARVQVGAFGKDTLVSGLGNLTFTLTAKADSLTLVSADSVNVTKDTDGTQLKAKLWGGTPAAGVSGRPVVFRIIDPAPADTPTVAFNFTRSADSLATDATGGVTAVLRPALNKTPPDRVVVRLTARRANGDAIPGSGRLIVVRFLHQ